MESPRSCFGSGFASSRAVVPGRTPTCCCARTLPNDVATGARVHLDRDDGRHGVAGNGTMGVVTAASTGTPLTVVCYDRTGASVDCKDTLIPAALPPLIVGDFRNAVFLSPTNLQAPAGVPPTQQLDYAEKASNAYAPDPKAPFGFLPGANLLRARVTHWYLRQASATDTPQLVRSFPA